MRYFNSKQKKALFVLSEGLCQNCGTSLPTNWHADHITPFSKYGITHISNGQALCPKCNLLKSNKMRNQKEIELRKWQQDCFAKLIKVRKGGGNSFLAVAGVGSGKTMFSSYTFNYLLKSGEFDSVIVISPTENIKKNWSVTFQKFFNIRVDHGYQFKYAWPRDCNGISITFQSLNPLNLEILKKYVNQRVVLIVDEVHHAGDDKSWGNAIREIGDEAGFVLLLSGTPDRNDNAEIPFVTYKKIGDRKYELQYDYSYGYAESVKDKVCCPVIFQRNSSTVETVNGYERLKNEDPASEIKNIYNNAIKVRPEGDCYVYQTFEKANQQLNEINTNRNENYAGLIVCNSIADAKALYERIYNKYGVDFAELVTSDDKDSNRKIERFKESYKTWIISINMVSEGVDISRIRAIVYASNVTTRVRFVQVMGRGVRNPVHFKNNSDVCYMYIPEYKPLIDNATFIEEELRHIRYEIDSVEEEHIGGIGGKPTQISIEDIVLSSTSENSGNVYGGALFSQTEDVEATILATKYDVTKDKVLSMWKDILNIAGQQPSLEERRPHKIETITDEKDRYKKLVHKMVGRIHFDFGLEYRDIHSKLNKSVGKKNSLIFTLDEYKKKLELSKELYEKLKSQ
ncbi:MAG: DEAD/DEAH box helicase [Flavobacteriaceae bacterium]|nr:MAG: DEAD/DEAH box helicase [Flavobacteriaceae bacterium]